MWGVERGSGNGPEKPSFWRTGGAGLMRPDPGGGRGRACSPRWRGGGLTWVMDGRATAADAPGSGADQREYLGEERHPRHLQIIWADADVGGLLAVNVGSFANNLGPEPPLFALNLG